jgi:hypothetical protein
MGVISGGLGLIGQTFSGLPGTPGRIGSAASIASSLLGSFGQSPTAVLGGLGGAVSQLGTLTGSVPLRVAGQAVSVVAGGLGTINSLVTPRPWSPNFQPLNPGTAQFFGAAEIVLGFGQIGASFIPGRTGQIASGGLQLGQDALKISQALATNSISLSAGVAAGGWTIRAFPGSGGR